jgi:enoyl-CoA hydratase/carnithine racemase
MNAPADAAFQTIAMPDRLLPAARRLAREIVRNAAPVSVSLNRQLLWRMLTAAHPAQALRAESVGMLIRGNDPVCAEGVGAFLQKRPPDFRRMVPRDLPDIFTGRGTRGG